MGLRSLRLFRLSKAVQQKSFFNRNASISQQIRLHSDVVRVYRKLPPPSKHELSYSRFYGGLFWWWFTYNVLTADYVEFFGPPSPDPSKWTDEELGIPPIYE